MSSPRRRKLSDGSAASTLSDLSDPDNLSDDEDRRHPRPPPRQSRRCCLPYLLLYMAVVAAVGSNWRGALDLDHDIDSVRGKGGVNGTTGAVDLSSLGVDEVDEPIGSFFDCSRKGARCRHFRPGEFLSQYYKTVAKDGAAIDAGRDRTTKNKSDEVFVGWRREIGLENANLPALDSLSWWMEGDEAPPKASAKQASPLYDRIRTHVRLPRNITYIHLHKCGGTSLQGALYRRARRIRNTRFRKGSNDTDSSLVFLMLHRVDALRLRADVHTYKHSFGGGSVEKKKKWDEERVSHIRAIEAAQSSLSSASDPFPIFTVVRDPIDRFLSAVQQVMHYNADFRAKCLREPPKSLLASLVSAQTREDREATLRRETIRCAIEDMAATSYRRDVHLVPMASHFRLLDNLNVSVFRMEDIGTVLMFLGNDPNSDAPRGNGAKTTIHARDRSNVEYATSSILAKLSSNDCDEDMIRQICSLYCVDVELMRWLEFGGEATERCKS